MQTTILRSFLAVAHFKSVRRGADNVHITPSAVSRHIAVLERIVGAALFERRSKGMTLTAEGEIMQKHAMRIMGNFDVAKSAVDEIRGLRRGVVRVAAMEAVTSSLVNPTIRDFMAEHIGLFCEVEVVSRYNNGEINSLLRDEIDIGITYKLKTYSDIEYLAEFETPFAVIMAPNHPLAVNEKLSLRDLTGTPVAALHASSATRRMTEEALRSVGVQLEYTLVVNNIEMTKEFARTGAGVTILPAISSQLECRTGSLIAVPLSEWRLSRVRATICTRRGRPLTKAAECFVELLKLRCKPS
jgi:DNA-binding transcriptional LysR family regulator